MRKQAPRNRNRRLALVGFRAALFEAVVPSAFEVDIRAAERRNGRCGCNGPRARSAIDSKQDEASKMPEWTLRCWSLYVVNRLTRPLLQLAIPPASPDQFSRITTRQPFVARLAFFRQRDLDDF